MYELMRIQQPVNMRGHSTLKWVKAETMYYGLRVKVFGAN